MSNKKPAKKGVTNDIQLVKIAFPKKKVTIDVVEDLGMPSDYEGVKFVMWADPSIAVLTGVLSATTKDEPTESDADTYFDSIKELIIDSNIDGLDFSTLEGAITAFDHKSLPWGFVGQVAAFYCAYVITQSEHLKKMYGLSEPPANSGEGNNSEE